MGVRDQHPVGRAMEDDPEQAGDYQVEADLVGWLRSHLSPSRLHPRPVAGAGVTRIVVRP
jgi:hypothetical protein